MRDAKRSLVIFLCIIVFVLWIGSLIFLGISIYENFEVIKEALWELLKTITIIFGLIIAVFIILGEGPPEIPEVEYAEFPFEVVYSIDDEVYEISDAYVCSYSGVSATSLIGSINWRTHLKHSRTEYIELYEKEDGTKICLYAGSPEYYMLGEYPFYGDHVPGEYLHSSGNDRYEEISFEEAKEKYGLEIISATFSEPMSSMHKTKLTPAAITVACNILALFAFIVATRLTVRKYCYGVFKRKT